MAGLSEVFTQDLEDMPPLSVSQQGASPAANNPPTPSQAAGHPNGSGPVPSAKNGTSFLISPKQFNQLEGRIEKLGLDKGRVKAWVLNATKGKVKYFSHLNQEQFKKLDEKLDEWVVHPVIQGESIKEPVTIY